MATTTTPEALADRVRPPTPAARRTRVGQLGIGVMITVVTALGFVLYNASSVERAPVLTLADDIGRGHVLTAEDLTVAYVGTDEHLAATPADGASALIGRAAVSDMPAGTLVVSPQFATAATLIPGAGVVGLALGPGQYPTSQLRIGDRVNVVVPSDEQPEGRRLVEAAEVIWIEFLGTQGQRVVSLLMDEATADAVGALSVREQVVLVLVARDDGEVGQ